MTENEKNIYWLRFSKFQKTRELAYVPLINKALRNQVKHVIDNNLSQSSIATISYAELYQVLKDLYNEAALIYGASIVKNLPKTEKRYPMGFSQMMRELMENYFRLELLNTVNDITATTREKIQEIFIKATNEGLSFNDIIKLLTEQSFTKIRAKLIARTETVTAANQGAMFAAQSVGLKMNKVWISAKDFRTRRLPRYKFDHFHMNGVTVGFDELFDVSGQKMQQPGDRKHGATAGNICNCRCTVAFVEKK
jgi:uncharacterized protein with gpF-like domain